MKPGPTTETRPQQPSGGRGLSWRVNAPADLGTPVWDNHFHLDPNGRGLDAVDEFVRAGGTGFMLVHKPYYEGEARVNRSVADHERQMGITLGLADKVRAAYPDLTVGVALAPHPAEFTKLLDIGMTIDDAAAIYEGALEVAAGFVRDGRAQAMAEVGRPHWQPVDPVVWAKANELMVHAFTLAKEAGCAVQIHAETATPESFADLRRHVDMAGLSPDKVVKHYSTPIVDTALNHGLWPSVLIGKNSAETAIAGNTRFLMETDYMDDPRYPGAVLGPKTVPKRTRQLLDKGLMSAEQAHIVHGDNVRALYGLEPRA